jgi:hypothetical protein
MLAEEIGIRLPSSRRKPKIQPGPWEMRQVNNTRFSYKPKPFAVTRLKTLCEFQRLLNLKYIPFS